MVCAFACVNRNRRRLCFLIGVLGIGVEMTHPSAHAEILARATAAAVRSLHPPADGRVVLRDSTLASEVGADEGGGGEPKNSTDGVGERGDGGGDGRAEVVGRTIGEAGVNAGAGLSAVANAARGLHAIFESGL